MTQLEFLRYEQGANIFGINSHTYVNPSKVCEALAELFRKKEELHVDLTRITASITYQNPNHSFTIEIRNIRRNNYEVRIQLLDYKEEPETDKFDPIGASRLDEIVSSIEEIFSQ